MGQQEQLQQGIMFAGAAHAVAAAQRMTVSVCLAQRQARIQGTDTAEKDWASLLSHDDASTHLSA